jgi:tRNA A-37 threonylcarbamoyl transferase component Bud32
LAWVDADLIEWLGHPDWLDPARLSSALGSRLNRGGRGRTGSLPAPDASFRLHLREFRHGGWLGPVLGPYLHSPRRPLAELVVTAALREAGAPVPRPAFVLAWRAGPGWRAVSATYLETGSVDARAFLAEAPSRPELLDAAAAAGDAIRRFHDAGGCHPDLHIGNLLVRRRSQGSDVVVVDLDRARRLAEVAPARRMLELMRLHRSLLKRGLSQTIGARGYARFWSSYVRGDRGLRCQLRSHLAREQRWIALHQVGYRLRGSSYS